MVWIRLTFIYLLLLGYQNAAAQCNGPIPIITGSTISLSCSGNCDGAIDITVTGGTGPFTYEWPTGENIEDLTGLCAGSYCVTVTDNNNCSAVACFEITEPSAISVNMVVLAQPNTGQADGAIQPSISGGSAPYTYFWNTGDSQQTLAGIPEGTYCVTVTDANGCTDVSCIDLISLDIEIFIDGPSQLCIGECGIYTAYDATGAPLCFYYWEGPQGQSSTSSEFEMCATSPGFVSLFVEGGDCSGGVNFVDFSVEVVSTIPLEVISTSAASCPDNNSTSACEKTCANSTITYTVPGSQGLDLEWEVLGAESYVVDENIVTVDWGNPGAGEVNAHFGGGLGSTCVLQLNCHQTQQAPQGSAECLVAGGNGPYSYFWSNGEISSSVNNLDPGTYQVTVTDGDGIIEVCEVSIEDSQAQNCNNPLGLSNIQIQHPTCAYESNGGIQINVTGGSGSYSYFWSPNVGPSAPFINNLTAGIYCVTITDATGCSLSECFSICDPEELWLNTQMINHVFNPGGSEGNAYVQALGGTSGMFYEVIWSNGQNGYDLTDVGVGYYGVTVTDANGCTAESGVNIIYDEVCNLNGYLYVNQMASTCSSNDGSVSLSITNWFQYSEVIWSDGSSEEDRTDLAPGVYCVTITDATQCVDVECIEIYCNDNIAPVECSGEGSLCIDIIPEPQAAFTSNPPDIDGLIEICRGQSVLFQNQSDNSENYVWQLGDGYSTSAQDVEHVYTESGLFNVLLIARNECFCIDTTVIKVLVSDDEIPEIECVGTVCENETVTYSSTVDCGIFNWSISSNGTITSGGGISDDYITINWGPGPVGEVTLQVSACTGNICASPTTVNVPIIMDNVFIEGPAKVCPGEVGSYSILQWSGTEYFWSASPFGEIKSGQGTNTVNIKWNVESAVVDQQWVSVTYNNCYLECGGESTKNVDITPDFYLAGPIEACENSSSEYMALDELTDSPVLCNWSVLYADSTAYWSSASPSAVASIDWPVTPGKYILQATAVNVDDYCTELYTIFVGVISGPPAVNGINGQNAICPGEFYTYEAQSTQANVAFSWTINNGGTFTETTGDAINVQWGASPPYELSIIQTSTAGLPCVSDPFTMEISTIGSVSISGPTSACIENISQYSSPPIGNAAYDWTVSPIGAGTILSGQGSELIEIIWHQAGNATVGVSVCGASETRDVTVFGYPEPEVIHPDSLCANETGLVTVSSVFSSYSWRNELGTQISASNNPNLAPGFYELVVTNSAGCEGQTTFRINELPSPVINISTPGLDFFCIPAGFPIPTLYALNTEDGYTYEWYQNGSPLGIFADNYTPNGAGTFYVVVVDGNDCSSNSNSITLSQSCGGGGGPPAPGIDCDNVDFTSSNGPTCPHGIFENISTNYVPGSVQWNFGDPASGAANFSNLENPEHFFSSAGFYNIKMAVTKLTGGICIIAKPFEVPAQADFDVLNTCPGLPVEFTDISTFTPQTTITDYDWDFGDPSSGTDNLSTEQNPTHIYENIGTYDVTLIITAQTGCTSTINKSVTILAPPVASFPEPDVACQATAVAFDMDANVGITSFEWNFDDPTSGAANTSRLANTFHAFSDAGIFDVQVTVFNIYGCSDSTSVPVTIEPNALTGVISMIPGSPICEGDTTTLTVPPSGVSWLWSDGSTTESISSSETGTFDVTITDDLGCIYTPPTAVLDIVPEPDATIKVTEYNEYGQPIECFFNGYILCEGEDVFMNILGADGYTYVWSNGQSGDEVIFDEEHGGTLPAGEHEYTVTVTDSSSGCTSVEGPYTIIVNPVPTDIMIISSPPGPICEQITTAFTVSNPDPQLSYIWNTGELGTTIVASTAGDYFVRGISSLGCEGESNHIGIYVAPDTRFVPDGCHTRCNPDTVCLPNIPGVIGYQWYFNDVAIAAPEGTTGDYIPTESGAYTVELFDINGCNALSGPFTIDLLPLDTAALVLDACEGGTVEYAGEILLAGSTTEFVFSNFTGCDSTVTVTVLEHLNYEESIDLSACDGFDVVFEGINYPTDTIILLNYMTQFGCDSIIQLNIASFPTDADSLIFETCSGINISYEGEELEPGSTTVFNLTNSFDCDSIISVTVLENPSYQDSITLFGCTGGLVNYEGVDYPVGASDIFTYATFAGCDSIIYLNVEELPTYTDTLNFESCAGTEITLPGGIILAAGSDTSLFLSTIAGCDSTLQIYVAEVPEFEINIDLEACTDGTVNYEGTDYPPGTELEFSYTTETGCDSIIYLSVVPLPTQNESLQLYACTGTTLEYEGQILSPGDSTQIVFSNQFNCDSVISVLVLENLSYEDTINLFGCTGSMVTYEGIDYPVGTSELFTYTTFAGCDSIIYLNIEALPTYAETLTFQSCAGSEITLPGGIILEAGADTTLFLFTEAGCDSTLQITVEEVAGFEVNVDLEACDGNTVSYQGTDYPPGTDLEFNYTSQEGCDSTVYLTVAGLAIQNEFLQLFACTGTTVEYAGEILEPGDSTQIVFTNQFNCDSVVSVIVLENLSYEDTVQLSACDGSVVNYEGVDYPVGTNEVFTYATLAGCDSIIYLNIEALANYAETLTFESCAGSQITLPGGIILDAGTDTTLFLMTTAGCDSTLQIIVEEVAGFDINIDLSACEGGTASYEGVDYPPGTDLEFNYTSQVGCDSTIYLSVVALPIQNESLELSTCVGTTIEYAGEQLASGSVTTFDFTNQFDCDSIVVVTVLEDSIYYQEFDLEGCDGSSVVFDGTSYPVGTLQQLNYISEAGCDSTIILNIAALPLGEEDLILSACEGGTVEYVGDDLAAGSVTTYIFVNQFGCDSSVLVTVLEVPVQNETVNLFGCEGESLIFGGVSYTVPTQTILNFTNQGDCDSIINLNIAAFPTYQTTIQLEGCLGETVDYEGSSLEVGSSTTFEYTTEDGCDSIIIVEVAAYDDFNFEVNSSDLICWNSDAGEIIIQYLSGSTGPFTSSIDGFTYQDTFVWSNLSGGDYTVYVQDVNGCILEDQINIPVIPPLAVEFNAPNISCDADSVIIQSALLNGFTDSMTYEWQHGFDGPIATAYDPGIYVLELSNLCETQNFEITVELEDGYRENYIYIPNAFSPNGDGTNEIFKAYPAEGVILLSYELHLYDRWGNTLYSTTDIDEGWDGVFLNEAMNPGVYVWWLRAKVLSCRNEIDLFEKGDVTIMK